MIHPCKNKWSCHSIISSQAPVSYGLNKPCFHLNTKKTRQSTEGDQPSVEVNGENLEVEKFEYLRMILGTNIFKVHVKNISNSTCQISFIYDHFLPPRQLKFIPVIFLHINCFTTWTHKIIYSQVHNKFLFRKTVTN